MAEERLGFDNVPEVYDRARPSYPDELFDDMLAYLGAPSGAALRALEIGAGTGKATASLLARGIEVTAVEIGANLASFLREKFRDGASLTVVNASFEDADVATAAYDLVVSATAFHWVDAAVRWEKARGALRPGGAIAIVETNQIKSEADRGFFAKLHTLIQRHRRGEVWDEPPDEDVTPPMYKDLVESGLFADVDLRRYRWDQTYSTSQYLDLTRSFGGTQAMTRDAAEAMVEEISELVDSEFGGSVTRPLVMTLALGRKEG